MLLIKLQSYVADYFEEVEASAKQNRLADNTMPTTDNSAVTVHVQPIEPVVGSVSGVPPQPLNFPQQPIPANQSPAVGAITPFQAPATNIPPAEPVPPVPPLTVEKQKSTPPVPPVMITPTEPKQLPLPPGAMLELMPAYKPLAAIKPDPDAIPEQAAQIKVEEPAKNNLIVASAEKEEHKIDFSKLEAEFAKDIVEASQNPSITENILTQTMNGAEKLAENNPQLITPAKMSDVAVVFDNNPINSNHNRVFIYLLFINILLFSGVGFVIVLWKKLRIKKITTILDELRS